jgi:leucyl-tRNA synthetase
MGLAIDWSREIAACDPQYYKWNQWLFLQMLERGIAYRKTQVVNWDPIDQTVLANEQVIDGRGWRTGAVVEKREIPGYYLKITDYAGELLDQVEHHLDGWPDRVRTMQSNWIGRSIGVRFAFPHEITHSTADGACGALVGDGRLYVFTTRADTIMGVTFVAVAPEHPLATLAAARDPAIAAFIEEARHGSVMEADMATMEKKGVPTGLFVNHPITGDKVPVWVGNYVLINYGDGAVMGVPAHDERDFAFARKYGLAIRHVVDVKGQAFSDQAWASWYEDKANGICVNSGKYDGLAYEPAVEAIAADLAARGLGEKKIQWRLRDWGISRQRYWGTPIPMIHCADCGPVPVPYADLPVRLPEDLVPDGSGNPLAKSEAFLACRCPKCDKPARRETDTMDTFVDSAWYYMRYCSPDNHEQMVDARTDYWMPMDQYIGGIEHAVLHLLYARFWTKVMRDVTGQVPAQPERGLVTFDEPFTRLLCQGMVLNHIYSRKTDKGAIEYFWPDEVEDIHDDTGRVTGAKVRADGSHVEYNGVGTMSKSKNNGVDPQALIDRYGADTARLFVMFASPPEQTLEWSDTGVEGAQRFLRRLWAFAHAVAALPVAGDGAFDAGRLNAAQKNLRRDIHSVLKQADYDYQRLQYNTVVSAAMKMLNALEGARESVADGPTGIAVLRECLSILIRVLYPVVPHVTHGLWSGLGYAATQGDLLDAPWPQVDAAALVQDTLELVLQINGKVRGSVSVPAGADRAAIEAAALASEPFARLSEGRAAKKVVVVPGRLVNVVV